MKLYIKIISSIICALMLSIVIVFFAYKETPLNITNTESWHPYNDINYKNITWGTRYTKAGLGACGTAVPGEPTVTETDITLSLRGSHCGSLISSGTCNNLGLSEVIISKTLDWSQYDELFIEWTCDTSLASSNVLYAPSSGTRLEIRDKQIILSSHSGQSHTQKTESFHDGGTLWFVRNGDNWKIYDVGRFHQIYLDTVKNMASNESIKFFNSIEWSNGQNGKTESNSKFKIIDIWTEIFTCKDGEERTCETNGKKGKMECKNGEWGNCIIETSNKKSFILFIIFVTISLTSLILLIIFIKKKQKKHKR